MSIEKILEDHEQRLTNLELKNKVGSNAGFIQMYENDLVKHKSGKLCYEAIEDIHFDFHGDFRYTSYENFKVRLSIHRNKIK